MHSSVICLCFLAVSLVTLTFVLFDKVPLSCFCVKFCWMLDENHVGWSSFFLSETMLQKLFLPLNFYSPAGGYSIFFCLRYYFPFIILSSQCLFCCLNLSMLKSACTSINIYMYIVLFFAVISFLKFIVLYISVFKVSVPC